MESEDAITLFQSVAFFSSTLSKCAKTAFLYDLPGGLKSPPIAVSSTSTTAERLDEHQGVMNLPLAHGFTLGGLSFFSQPKLNNMAMAT